MGSKSRSGAEKRSKKRKEIKKELSDDDDVEVVHLQFDCPFDIYDHAQSVSI